MTRWTISSPTLTDNQPPRGSLRLLLDPFFGSFIVARLVTATAVWVHNIVAAVVAYELSESAFVVGLVSVAQFGPQLMLAPLSGALADRGDRRLQMVVGRLLVSVGTGGLAIWIYLVGVQGLPGAWAVVLAASVCGIGFVIVSPAQNALIPSLVRPVELGAAMALNSVPPILTRAAGPAIGVFIAVTMGPAAAFATAAAANLVFALVLFPMRVPSRRRGTGDGRVVAVLSYVRRDPVILVLLVGIAAVGVGADPVLTLGPSLSVRLGHGTELVGVLASSFGVGAAIAFALLGPLARRLGHPRLTTTGLLMMAVGAVGAGAGHTAPLVIAAFALAGSGMTLSLTSLSTRLQERAPDALRGRIMALWGMAFLGSRPIAAPLNGGLADATSPMVALLVVAVLVTLAAWACRPRVITRPQPA